MWWMPHVPEIVDAPTNVRSRLQVAELGGPSLTVRGYSEGNPIVKKSPGFVIKKM
jgi:hypothetical protein